HEFGEVELEVAGVGAATGRRNLVRRTPPHALARLRRGLQRERLQDAEEAVDPFRIAVPRSQLPRRRVHRLRHRQPDRTVGPGLGAAGRGHAARRAAVGAPLEDPCELAYLAVASGELGRSLPGAGRVGIPYGVHDRTVFQLLAKTLDPPSTR